MADADAFLTPERWNKVQELFESAQGLDARARSAFIKRQCAGDAALESEVTRLLVLNHEAGSSADVATVRLAHVSEGPLSSAVLAVGDIVAERFRIVGLLGRGGMGEVYEAEDAVLGDRVAVKVMRPGPGDPKALAARFRREVQLARRVSHPGVCRVHDVAVHRSPQGDDRIVLTMELIRGETLAARLRGGPLAASVALDFARQIGGALEAAHGQRVLHRDVKPANILLEPRQDGGERAVLTDFGLARATGPDAPTGHTAKGMLLGTPEYMAPEQLRGTEPSARSDLYSFGVVLYEMVTGTHPFPADSYDRGIARRLVEPPRPVTDVAPDLDPIWGEVLSRALDRDPANRFSSVRELVEALSPDGSRTIRPRPGIRAVAAAVLGAVGVALAVIAVIATGIRSSVDPAPPLTDKDTIVLADFVNTTGDPLFDDTLKLGLSVQLRQSPFLNILTEQKLGETLKLMGRAPGDMLTPQLARDACVRTNSKAMLTGSISRLGSQYVLGLRAQECSSSADLAQEQVEAPRKEDVLKALDKAAASVRRSLGESLSTLQKYDAPVEEATTPSLEALQAYSFGLKSFRDKGDAAALVFHKRAVELDPDFAMAYIALGSIYANLAQDGPARENFEKAYALRDRASERERYRITADYFTFASGELEKGTLVYEQWALAYPRDWNPFGRLVLNRMSFGQYERAVTDGLAAIRLFPEGISTPVNLMLVYLALNRLSDAKTVYEQTIARLPNHSRLHIIRYVIAFFEGDAAEMARQSERTMGTQGDADMQLSFRSDTEAYAGRLAQARDLSQQAAGVAERNDQKETAALWLLNAALREAEIGNASKARELTTIALGLASSPNVQILAALASARSGGTQRATALAAEVSRRLPRSTEFNHYWLPAIRASMALGRSDAAGAIELLRVASSDELGQPFPNAQMGGTLYPVYVRGEAYLKAGRAPEAAAEFQKLLDHRGVVLNFVLGALSHLQLGRARAMSGDREGARKAYDDYFALWKDADPDIPILKAARTEYRVCADLVQKPTLNLQKSYNSLVRGGH